MSFPTDNCKIFIYGKQNKTEKNKNLVQKNKLVDALNTEEK